MNRVSHSRARCHFLGVAGAGAALGEAPERRVIFSGGTHLRLCEGHGSHSIAAPNEDLGRATRARLATIMPHVLVLLLLIGCEPGNHAPVAAPPPPKEVTAQKAAPPARRSIPATAYVGSARCAECHAEISESYAAHPMARSAGLVADVPPIEDYHAAVVESVPWQYRAERTEDGVFHHEILPGPDDEPLYDQRVAVDYAIGSGQRGRTYLVDRDGYLFESPLTWYSTGRRWDLSPGYAGLNQHFERQIGDGCLACHVGTLNLRDNEPHRYLRPMFLEPGIGCERCHGPGADHIAFHASRRNAAETAEAGRDPIVNPADLDSARREAVCNQCHLQGDERILRTGRRDTDFRPGDALHDVWISFTRGTRVQGDAGTEAVSQVEQMQASRCYQASAGRFGCTSCHDPHRVPPRDQIAEAYRQKCLACHSSPQVECAESAAARDAEQNSCIACHMPKLRATDVPHTSQTDHRVPRRKGTVSPAEAQDQSRFQVFGAAESQVPDDELQRARGLLMIEYAERKRDRVLAAEAIDLLTPSVEAAANDPVLWTKLGVGYELANDPDLARRAWTKAIELDPQGLEPQRRLALLLFDRYSSPEALPALEEFQARFPWDQRVAGRLVIARTTAGRFEEALDMAQQGVQRFPAAVPFHEWLANASRSRGQTAPARRHEAILRLLKPAR